MKYCCVLNRFTDSSIQSPKVNIFFIIIMKQLSHAYYVQPNRITNLIYSYG